ncbi:MAG: hypothetical protein AAFY03_07645, partial [Pseudomonadota bacterium]
MGRITHICFSDVHAGAEASLGTHLGDDLIADYDSPSPTSTALGATVRGLLARHREAHADAGKPQLILMGDFLDLAFNDRGNAARSYVSWIAA